MVAALGVHQSQGTRLCLSGAKILAVTARGCVLAPLACSGLFTTTEERAEILGREGLQISLVKWSLWHLGYSCAHLIRAKWAWSSLAKKHFLLDLDSFRIWHRKWKKKNLNMVAVCLSVIYLIPCVSARWLAYWRDNWSLVCLMFKRIPICSLYQITWKNPTSSLSPLLGHYISSFCLPVRTKKPGHLKTMTKSRFHFISLFLQHSYNVPSFLP